MEIHNGGVYKLKITPGILKKYFQKFKTTPKKMDRVEARLIFLAAIKDFLAEKLTVDDFCYIATTIYFDIRKPSWYDAYDVRLASMLGEANETTLYKLKSKEDLKKTRERLKEYYLENKHLLP